MHKNLRRLNEHRVGQLFTELEKDNAFVDEATTEAALRVLEDEPDTNDISSFVPGTAGSVVGGSSRGARKAGSLCGHIRKGASKKGTGRVSNIGGRVSLNKALKNQHKVYCDAWMSLLKNEVSLIMTQCSHEYEEYINTNLTRSVESKGGGNTSYSSSKVTKKVAYSGEIEYNSISNTFADSLIDEVEEEQEVIRPALMSFVDSYAYPPYIFKLSSYNGCDDECSGPTTIDAKATKKPSGTSHQSASCATVTSSFVQSPCSGLYTVAGVPLGPSYISMTSPPPCELSTTPYCRWQWTSPALWDDDKIEYKADIKSGSINKDKQLFQDKQGVEKKKRQQSRISVTTDDVDIDYDTKTIMSITDKPQSTSSSSAVVHSVVRDIPVVSLPHVSNTHIYGNQSRRLCSICYRLAAYTCNKCNHQTGGGARFCSVSCGDVHEEMRCNKYVVL